MLYLCINEVLCDLVCSAASRVIFPASAETWKCLQVMFKVSPCIRTLHHEQTCVSLGLFALCSSFTHLPILLAATYCLAAGKAGGWRPTWWRPADQEQTRGCERQMPERKLAVHLLYVHHLCQKAKLCGKWHVELVCVRHSERCCGEKPVSLVQPCFTVHCSATSPGSAGSHTPHVNSQFLCRSEEVPGT